MSRLKKATDEFIYKNEARISGYVVSKRTVKMDAFFTFLRKRNKINRKTVTRRRKSYAYTLRALWQNITMKDLKHMIL